MKVAGIVIIYEPNEEVIGNITSWSDEVDFVYLIDNSKNRHEELLKIKNARYFHLKKNRGLCGGMNYGCRKAINDGMDYLAALNQDTWISKGEISKLFKTISGIEGKAVCGTNFKYIYRKRGKRIFSNESAYDKSRRTVPWVIMAGCAFSSKAFMESGGFDEKLFIDNLDIDFCLRLRKKGYDIIRLGDIYIFQEPGNTVRKKVGNRVFHISGLSAERRYLTFRNERYLRKKWQTDYNEYRLKLYKHIISIIFFESNKVNKLINCLKGWCDGLSY